jgi:large subunit ribosomal protein L25
MAASFELNMYPRDQLGTAASRRLRRAGKVPVVLYGKGETNVLLSMEHSLLERLLENDVFYSSILNIQAGETHYQAILKGLKHDPVKPKILDIELLRIYADKPITLSIPLHFIGENVAPGIKQGGGMISYQLNIVRVTCLPKNIPEFIEVDISHLGISEPVMLSQLKLPNDVSLAAREDRVVVTILAPRGQSTAATTKETAA